MTNFTFHPAIDHKSAPSFIQTKILEIKNIFVSISKTDNTFLFVSRTLHLEIQELDHFCLVFKNVSS